MFQKNFYTRFCKEVNSLPSHIHTVIISSEHFAETLQNTKEIHNLKKTLMPFFSKISILVYIRNQQDRVISQYSTKVKSGYNLSLKLYMKELMNNKEKFNYDLILKNWEQVFTQENIKLRIFDKREFINNSLLDDFTFQINKELIPLLNQEIRTINPSLSVYGFYLARIVNIIFPRITKRGENKLRSRLILLIEKYIKGKTFHLSNTDKQKVFNKFEKGNNNVCKRYFPMRSNLFK